MEEDALAFITELERRHNAPLGWKTYATWYGNNNDIFREFGVFLYRCRNSFYFEDFERTPSMFGISIKPRKPKAPFIKYEGSFHVDEVVDSRPVPKALAIKCVEGRKTLGTTYQAKLLERLFKQMVEMVTLKDGTVHFFELMDRKQFINELQIRNEEE